MSRNKSLWLLSALGSVAMGALSSTHASVSSRHSAEARLLPEPAPRYEFSLAVIGLKPAASNLNYVIYNKALPLQQPNWEEIELRPSNSFAFELGGRYFFPEGRDVSLDWTHLNSSTNSSVAAPNDQYFLGPDYEIGPDAGNIRNAYGRVQFKYDVVNLDAGQFFTFDRHFGIRFFGGISNGFLRERVDATYTGNVPSSGSYPGPFSISQEVNANFYGMGPRFGFESRYRMDSGFGLLGQAAFSALIGSTQSKTTYVTSSGELQSTLGESSNFQSIWDQNVTQVVPGFDAKLGLSYIHALKRGVLLSFEGGYQAAVYINAINQYLPATVVKSITTTGIYVATMSHTQSNYSVQGPFLRAVLTLV